MDGSGIKSWWGDFLHVSILAQGPTQPPKQQVPGYSQWGSGQGMALNTNPHLVPRLKKEWCCTYPPYVAIMACSGVNLTFTLFKESKEVQE
jgi:hypothetical protein